MRDGIMDELFSKISGEAERVHSDWLVLELVQRKLVVSLTLREVELLDLAMLVQVRHTYYLLLTTVYYCSIVV